MDLVSFDVVWFFCLGVWSRFWVWGLSDVGIGGIFWDWGVKFNLVFIFWRVYLVYILVCVFSKFWFFWIDGLLGGKVRGSSKVRGC